MTARDSGIAAAMSTSSTPQHNIDQSQTTTKHRPITDHNTTSTNHIAAQCPNHLQQMTAVVSDMSLCVSLYVSVSLCLSVCVEYHWQQLGRWRLWSVICVSVCLCLSLCVSVPLTAARQMTAVVSAISSSDSTVGLVLRSRSIDKKTSEWETTNFNTCSHTT